MNSDDVDTTTWLKALDEVEQLAPIMIGSGHRKATAQGAIASTRDCILFVRNAMQNATESWTDYDTAYAQTDRPGYKDLPALEEDKRGNAYRIYIDIEQSQLKAENR
ncbi:hypothetical protein [Microvirga makkahensis]|uniref:Uncharacterized protein n=1 Tax=Microvirga makkahensis TaxID=1128670 RepID=A0A7X3MPE4_9HYPH|nr:hypothetical protein [Microvirga makkahensis]MXQ10767.1 hypothetical protein [Microvirga makkahensis]